MEPEADSRARRSPACDDMSLSLAFPHNGPVSDWSMSLGDMERAWQAFEAWQAEHERVIKINTTGRSEAEIHAALEAALEAARAALGKV